MSDITIQKEESDCEPVLYVRARTGHNKGSMGDSGNVVPVYVSKTWGSEHIFQNNDKYCCKLLTIEPGMNTSMHYHIDKHETMIVTEGILYIDYISEKELHTICIKPGNAFVIAPGLPHSLRAGDTVTKFIEASTPSYDKDSIRIR